MASGIDPILNMFIPFPLRVGAHFVATEVEKGMTPIESLLSCAHFSRISIVGEKWM